MIIIRYTPPFTYVPQSSGASTGYRVLPPITDCPNVPLPPFIGDIGDGWNCIRCASDLPYFGLFRRGDIIPLQLSFPDNRSTDITTPDTGWKHTGALDWYIEGEMLSGCGTTVLFSSISLFASEFWVGYDPKIGSVQTLFVDTANVPVNVNVFRLRFSYRDRTGAVIGTYYTEPFKVVDPCQNTVLIQGFYGSRDCLQHSYLSPTALNAYSDGSLITNATPFSLQWRYQGDMVLSDLSTEKELNDNDRVISAKNIKRFELKLWPIPPWAAEILGALTAADTTLVDGQAYVNWGNIARNTDSKMFIPVVECEQRCSITSFNCDL